MPSVGRKFLLAGKGGLNLTHSEAFVPFMSRYAERQADLQAALEAFTPQDLRDWAADLGVDTFVGTSGRVFPVDLKAAPLLRAWLHRLRGHGVRFHMRHRWLGWHDAGALRFSAAAGEVTVRTRAVLLALGGASWSRLGSDGAWVALLRERGADVAPLQPSNCGFDAVGGWSAHLRERFAGKPIKPVAMLFNGRRQQGEFVLTESGIEGSLVYAFSAALRDAISANGQATLHLDLLPQHSAEQIATQLARGQGGKSLGSFLNSQFNLQGAKAALLHEAAPADVLKDPARLAQALKALPITLGAARPIDEAISSAGGVRFEALDEHWQLRALPGVFVAGEMLDWEAPTGGYLLSACFATGRAAAQGLLQAAPLAP